MTQDMGTMLIQRALAPIQGVGAIAIPVNGLVGQSYVGADDMSGLTYEEQALMQDMTDAMSAGVGAALPNLFNRFNFAAFKNPRFAQAAQNRGINPTAKPPMQQQQAYRPAIAVQNQNPMQSGNMFQPQGVVQQNLNVTGPTELPLNSPVINGGASLLIQVRPNFPIRGTGLVISEDSRSVFAVSGLSIGGVAVFAGAGEVNADMYSPDSTWRTLFPSLDTSQTLDVTLRNRSGAPLAFNGVLKGEAARPGL